VKVTVKRDVQIWHDKSGQIVGWGYAPEGPLALVATPLAEAELEVLSRSLPEDELNGLHETHRVDLESRELVRRRVGQSNAKAPSE
jgi:hypothetical protein